MKWHMQHHLPGSEEASSIFGEKKPISHTADPRVAMVGTLIWNALLMGRLVLIQNDPLKNKKGRMEALILS